MSAITIEQETSPLPEGRRKLRWWHMLVPLAVPLVLLTLMVVVAFVAAKIATRMGYSVWGLRAEVQAFFHSTFGALIVGAIFYVLLLVGVWFVFRRRGALTLAEYFTPVRANELWKAALCGIVLAGMFIGAGAALAHAHLITPRPTETVRLVTAHSIRQLIPSFALAAIIGPLAEEVYFRGLILSWLRQRLSLTYAAAITAVLFSLIHGFLFTQPLTAGIFFSTIIAALGYINALWLARTGSMWAPFTVHAAYNGTIVLLASAAAMSGVT